MNESKHKIPLKVRIQIYHSFLQSRINYCSLVWGFAAKSHIESLFSKQKEVHAIMLGHVNYFYNVGTLPANTERSYKKYGLLTIHSIIVKKCTLIYT